MFKNRQLEQFGEQMQAASCVFRPVLILCVNYSPLCVAVETEQLFREQLIQATSRFRRRCHK